MKLLRCDVVQGYYFSKPLPMKKFEEWMEGFNSLYLEQNRENIPDFYRGGGYKHEENSGLSKEVL